VQRVPVKIVLDPKDPLAAQLRPGLSVTATVDTHSKPVQTAAQPAPQAGSAPQAGGTGAQQ
jgi:membrane fusion protein (multidrug efflux system)